VDEASSFEAAKRDVDSNARRRTTRATVDLVDDPHAVDVTALVARKVDDCEQDELLELTECVPRHAN
jgi:hypothetical protein